MVAGAVVAAIASAALQAADNLPSILISRQLSESEHLAAGDVVRLSDSAEGSRVQQFRVAGVYEPTPDPARLGARPGQVDAVVQTALLLELDRAVRGDWDWIAGTVATYMLDSGYYLARQGDAGRDAVVSGMMRFARAIADEQARSRA